MPSSRAQASTRRRSRSRAPSATISSINSGHLVARLWRRYRSGAAAPRKSPTLTSSNPAMNSAAKALPPLRLRAIFRRRCLRRSATRSPTACGSSARASPCRSPCSTRCAPIIRCVVSFTTLAPTGATCSPGSCSRTTTAMSTSSLLGASSSLRANVGFYGLASARRRHRHGATA